MEINDNIRTRSDGTREVIDIRKVFLKHKESGLLDRLSKIGEMSSQETHWNNAIPKRVATGLLELNDLVTLLEEILSKKDMTVEESKTYAMKVLIENMLTFYGVDGIRTLMKNNNVFEVKE